MMWGKLITCQYPSPSKTYLLQGLLQRATWLLFLTTLPGWYTSYLSLVTTSVTKRESAFAKKGTEATKALQLKLITSWVWIKILIRDYTYLFLKPSRLNKTRPHVRQPLMSSENNEHSFWDQKIVNPELLGNAQKNRASVVVLDASSEKFKGSLCRRKSIAQRNS